MMLMMMTSISITALQAHGRGPAGEVFGQSKPLIRQQAYFLNFFMTSLLRCFL